MSKDGKTKLGKILLKQQLVDPNELNDLLEEQRTDHQRLASKALSRGLVDEVRLLKALSEQHGIPAVNLDDLEIDLTILQMIPKDIAVKHIILPISMTADAINLTMANPDDQRVIDEIEFVSGRRVFPHVALHAQMVATIEACYSSRDAGEVLYRGRNVGKHPVITEAVETDGALHHGHGRSARRR